jgi:CRISPR-associated protein Csb2
MLTLAFRFPAGRYHATPWGRHVNEADVGWPPDLWRMTRALIATWHRKVDPVRFPREQLASLLAALATEPPQYRLPDAVHFHTRHYMPVRDKPSLVFDAFAQVGREEELIVHWPELNLERDQVGLLDELIEVMGYLGRAESWVDARRREDWRGACNCYPSEEAVDRVTGEVKGDLVTLWLPVAPRVYAQLQAAQRAAALAQERAELHRRRAHAIAEGRKTKLSDPAKAAIPRAVAQTLPEDWLAAISLDTGELQAAGWSAPPAARQMYYLRPKDALRFMAVSPAAHRTREPDREITTARFALYAKPRPAITDAVRVGETLRLAVMGRARRLFGDNIPASLSGHDLPAGNRHGHAFFLPEKDHDGRIGHLLVHAPGGLDVRAQTALAELKAVRTREGTEWKLLLEGLSDADGFPGSVLTIASARWESVTPYLHPWHRKRGFDLPEQVARECRLRGLPEPTVVQHAPPGKPRTLDFRRFRSKNILQQPDRQGCFLRLEFAEPLRGPLALGFACHFGLGLFAPLNA